MGAALAEDPKLVPRTHKAAYNPLKLLGNPSWILQSFRSCLKSQGHSYKRLGIKPPLVLLFTATQVGSGKKSPEALSTLTHKGCFQSPLNQPKRLTHPSDDGQAAKAILIQLLWLEWRPTIPAGQVSGLAKGQPLGKRRHPKGGGAIPRKKE